MKTPAHQPLLNTVPGFLHGADYNPDQWLSEPQILEADMAAMQKAGVTTVSLGIFSWASYEAEEGQYQFAWLEEAIERLHHNGIKILLATPSGAKPTWMSERYPEIRRCRPDGSREPSGGRHNHCWTSPVYREKVRAINTALAERFGQHPAVVAWHISNEYSGECHCPLCYAAFRKWLQERYVSLDNLNDKWWTSFWSHRFKSWEEIQPLDGSIEGMVLDWRRFVNASMVDFMKMEIASIKAVTPQLPCTTNFMGTIFTNNYWEWAEHLDFISNDSYPAYSDSPSNVLDAASESMNFDLDRSLKRKPFLLMESTPNQVNWHRVPYLKAPGIHRLEMLQSIAHGSDGSHYFQWRKGRGGSEKFHGAVIDHANSLDTRTFREVAAHGELLRKLAPAYGSATHAEIGLIYDWECEWAIDCSGHKPWTGGERYGLKNHSGPVKSHYRGLWRNAVSVEILNQDRPFDVYRMLVAPALYLLKPGTAARMAEFVANGGILVSGFNTGVVDQFNRCWMNGFPGDGLRELFGVWAEEIDYLSDGTENPVRFQQQVLPGMTAAYAGFHACEVLHAESAEVIATFTDDFYAGSPAITRRKFGRGEAWYIGTALRDPFYEHFYRALLEQNGFHFHLALPLPAGVTVQARHSYNRTFLFVLNFSAQEVELNLQQEILSDLESGDPVDPSLKLAPFGSRILVRPRQH